MTKELPSEKPKKNTGEGVIGIDEVGRGPCAGPVSVCAFYISDQATHKKLMKEIFGGNIKDSKKLTKSMRNKIHSTIRKKRGCMEGIYYSISSRSAAYIDRHGISRATQACVDSCLRNLAKCGVDLSVTSINLDAGLKVSAEGLTQRSFVKGDERFLEIALASITAKVTRDKHMERLARVHKWYFWEKNAGYGTLEHKKAIIRHGVTPYHRVSYLKNL